MANVTVGTVFITGKNGQKLHKTALYSLGLALSLLGLAITPGIVFLQGMRSQHPSRQLRCGEVYGHMAKMNGIGKHELSVHVPNTVDAKVWLVLCSSMVVDEYICR